MSVLDGGASASASTRTLSELSEEEPLRLSLDLVAAAKQNIGFLRHVAESHWLHHTTVLLEAIRRYDELWMPMVADLTSDSGELPMILPPLDVEWVWFCHSLNPVTYREYCESRFSKLIGKAAIFNEENREYALERCSAIWTCKYPSESFENESDPDSDNPKNVTIRINENLFEEFSKQRCLFSMFSRPYMLEIVYLIAAKHRYKGLLYMLQRFADKCSSCVPTSDILLMWITHKSYPTAYAIDVKEMEGNIGKVVGSGESSITEEDLQETKKLWEIMFDQPYEKAGCPPIFNIKPPIYWEAMDTDVNVKYKPLLPRFLLEVYVSVKSIPKSKKDKSEKFLRFRLLRCHRDLKINNDITSNISSSSWKNILHIFCEFGTKGISIELHRKGGICGKGSKVVDVVTFLWNDLLRAPSITLEREVGERLRVVGSITPPAQAPYLLKCVADRVTDDSGAMVSEVVLKMNNYRPQEGRWLSRTVLDHGGRECFVIRMRVGEGFWRRGGNKPSVVNWEDRCIEIREGSWSYFAGSIGKAPEKVVGTATPKVPSQGWQSSWSFSTGHVLSLQLESSTSANTFPFDLQSTISTDSQARLLKGRKMQYQENAEDENDEEDFITLVRFTDENTQGKATALMNWKLCVVEFSPEEDAVFVLLLCVSISKSFSEMRKVDFGNLLTRKRLKEVKLGTRDWGSVILVQSKSSSSSPYVRPWYYNANAVMAPPEGVDYVTKQPALSYSPEEGDDRLYKQALFG